MYVCTDTVGGGGVARIMVMVAVVKGSVVDKESRSVVWLRAWERW